MSAGPMRLQNVALLLGLAWLAVAAQLLVLYWAGTADILSDTDDAMRLVELRAYLDGRGWFDLHEPRVSPPAGYDTHWSRLIDAGLAGLFRVLELVADPGLAERLMRTIWPLVWLVPAMAGVLLLALRLGGAAALPPAAVLLVLGLPAFQQFVPGRIDHHNVQITLAVLVLAATAWSDRRRWAAPAAGFLTALALAIGFESLAFVVLCGTALALRFACERPPADQATGPAGQALAGYGLALAAGIAVVFLTGVAPARWAVTACDALAINTAVPVAVAGVLLAVAARLAAANRVARLLAVATVAATAIALALALEPACRRGPFAMMDPAVGPIWLAHVKESQPLLVMAGTAPAVAATVAAFPLVALLAVLVMARAPKRRRDFATLTVAAVLLAAVVLMVGNAKLYVYAAWFGMPVVAAVLAGLADARLAVRSLVAVLLAPAVLGSLAGALATAIAGAEPTSSTRSAPDAVARACLTDASYRVLAGLPPGLVVAAIDYGPFILALTPHAVLGAPYHRLSEAILATDRIFALPPDRARPLLAGLATTHSGATYVAVCRTASTPAAVEARRPADGLEARLRTGAVPAWLAPVQGPSDAGAPETGLAIFRVLPEAGPGR
ncbi:MAG: hypothetical protein HXX10_10935 [Rhodoplanes sp.]|uniref:hypothetical protein n=1 Tax=Rhodoplanes sp. TaxID=1968906 RepID=UPI0017ADFD15|nr:hypothetical protein [Rhodoplanes sp.]NVO14541.1 hypothetical protein [Rhodoplanes sp.]